MVEVETAGRLKPVLHGLLLLLGFLLVAAACTAGDQSAQAPASATPTPGSVAKVTPIPTESVAPAARNGQFELRTVMFVERLRSFSPEGAECEVLRTVWMEAPKKWRLEPERVQGERVDCGAVNLSVSDGDVFWVYDAEGGFASRGRPSHITTLGAFFQEDALEDLDLDEDGSETRDDAYVRRLEGIEMAAGRQAYVVEWQPTSRRPSNTNPDHDEGIRRIWIDTESFLALRSEVYDFEENLLSTSVVERIEYNSEIAPDLFTFTPPPGTTVAE